MEDSLTDSDVLQTIAEIAIALTGFTGVVAFLGQRARGEWRAVDLFRFNQLLGGSLAALLFSFTPILLFRLGAPEMVLWRASSGLIATYIVGAFLLANRAIRRLPKAERVEIAPMALLIVQVLGAAVLSLQLLSAAGVVYPGRSAPVLIGLVWLLMFSAFQFVRLFRMLHGQSGDAA